jgi:hypothetical protein
MSHVQDDRPKRTIVGGRPRRRGRTGATIPRGVEVLIKKASLDPRFCQLLLEQRAAAAREIELELTTAETAILNSVPEAQLQAMIDHIKVPDAQRRAFLGQLGAAMLAAVIAGCTPPTETPEVETGIRPDEEARATPTPMVIEKGIRPEDLTRRPKATPAPEAVSTSTPAEIDTLPAPEDKPTSQVVRGIRPDRP